MAYIFTFFQFIQIFWWIFRHNFDFIFTFVNIFAYNSEISIYTMANSGLPQARRRSQRETIPYLIQTKDSQRQPEKENNTLYLWPRSKVWMWAHKRTSKPPRLKPKIEGIIFLLGRLSLNELNSNSFFSVEIIASAKKSYYHSCISCNTE